MANARDADLGLIIASRRFKSSIEINLPNWRNTKSKS